MITLSTDPNLKRMPECELCLMLSYFLLYAITQQINGKKAVDEHNGRKGVEPFHAKYTFLINDV